MMDQVAGGQALGSAASHCVYDLFVVYAATDAEFVRGYLLPALNLPPSRVRLVDDLPIGGVIVAEVERGVIESRFTVAVLSPAYLADRWAVFGEQLASHLSVDDPRIIPLRLTACDLPLRLDARVSLDFTDGARWDTQTGRLRDLVHAPPPAPEPIACPYPGMRAFGAADVGRFFGRGPEVDEGQATPADGNDVIATTVSQDRCPASGRISDVWPNAGHQTRQHDQITWT
jgi:hypothetical protein